MEDAYKLEVFCTNCDFKGEVDIPKGILVDDYKCPKCDVPAVKKSLKAFVMRPSTSFE